MKARSNIFRRRQELNEVQLRLITERVQQMMYKYTTAVKWLRCYINGILSLEIITTVRLMCKLQTVDY